MTLGFALLLIKGFRLLNFIQLDKPKIIYNLLENSWACARKVFAYCFI